MTSPAAGGDAYRLILYVAGASVLSMNAIERIRDVCDHELAGRVQLEVVDVHQEPGRVIEDDIVAVPTLLRKLPAPLRRLVGDLSTQRVLVALDLEPRQLEEEQ